MSILRAGRSSQIESVTIRKRRKTVHVNDRTQKSLKTAFLPIGRHPAFVSNYYLSKISNFLNKIFLFFLKKKLFIISLERETLRVPLSIPQTNLVIFPDHEISQRWQTLRTNLINKLTLPCFTISHSFYSIKLMPVSRELHFSMLH